MVIMSFNKLYISTVFLLFSTLQCISQSDVSVLKGCKYIYMPPIYYKDGSVDYYGIQTRIKNSFLEKGFLVMDDLEEGKKQYNESKENPCLILTCKVDHPPTSGFTNSLSISFYNCINQLVYFTKASSSMGADPVGNYRIAVKKAMQDIASMDYYYDSLYTPKIEYPKVEIVVENQKTISKYLDTSLIEPIEGIFKSYQDNSKYFYRLGIKKQDDNYIVIVLETNNAIWKQGEIKAYIDQSALNGIYSIKWFDDNKVSFEPFCRLENNAVLNIEFRDSEDKINKLTFIKIYPRTISSSSTSSSIQRSGSGFFISNDGLIGTNAHVVKNANKIEVTVSNELGTIKYQAKLVLIDNKNDVAILKIEDKAFGSVAIPFALIDKAEIGEKVFTIGFPLNDLMGTNYKVTDGIVSASTGVEDDIRYYQITVPLQPGNSGGPLFNSQGNIIGITSAKLSSEAAGSAVENVNYAIKATYLLSLMNMLPTRTISLPNNLLLGKELKEQVKVLKNYVCLINVE